MADISKIKLPNGTSYTIKDSTARNSITNITNGTTPLPYSKVNILETVNATLSDITNVLNVLAVSTVDGYTFDITNWTYNGVSKAMPEYIQGEVIGNIKITGLPDTIDGYSNPFIQGYGMFNINDSTSENYPIEYYGQTIISDNGVYGFALYGDFNYYIASYYSIRTAKKEITTLINIANLDNTFEFSGSGDTRTVKAPYTAVADPTGMEANGVIKSLNIPLDDGYSYGVFLSPSAISPTEAIWFLDARFPVPSIPKPWEYTDTETWGWDTTNNAGISCTETIHNYLLHITEFTRLSPTTFKIKLHNDMQLSYTLTGLCCFGIDYDDDGYGNRITYQNEDIEYILQHSKCRGIKVNNNDVSMSCNLQVGDYYDESDMWSDGASIMVNFGTSGVLIDEQSDTILTCEIISYE